MELTALVDRNSHLDDFDGGKIECADPPDMKGKKPLHMINCKSISLLIIFVKEKFLLNPTISGHKGNENSSRQRGINK